MLKTIATLCLVVGVACSPGQDTRGESEDEGGSGGTNAQGGGGGSGIADTSDVDASAPRTDAPLPSVTDTRLPPDAAAPRDAGMDATAPSRMFPSPCPPAPEACRIMPLGDSITDGVGSSGPGGGYRVPLFRAALKAGKNITFVGSGANGPTAVDGKPFPRQHEGHSGSFIQGLQYSAAGFVKTYKPHIVLLMIGTNDANRAPPADLNTAPARVGELVDLILQNAAPKTVVVVAQIVPTQDDANNVRVRKFNTALPAVIATRVAAGKPVALVDMYEAFTANPKFKQAYLSDGLHPNDAGYAVMSQTWWPAISSLLK